jgi:hypothetical protein
MAINTQNNGFTTCIYNEPWANRDMPHFRGKAASSYGHKQDIRNNSWR